MHNLNIIAQALVVIELARRGPWGHHTNRQEPFAEPKGLI
jgi:hypothetical protein